MIPRAFVPPTFRTRVKRALNGVQENPELFLLRRAADAEELRRALETRGYLLAAEPEAFDYPAWEKDALKARDEAIAAYRENRPYAFKSRVWDALREYLFHLFEGKCAYCEGSRDGVTPGSVEHFRPKSRYYWLAYDIRNYLPACTSCNGKKGDKFPLEPGSPEATAPEHDLALEKPMLLNPYELAADEFQKHLEFKFSWSPKKSEAVFVLLSPLTFRGKTSMDVFDLNGRDLPEARAKVVNAFLLAYDHDARQRPNPVLAQAKSGAYEFSQACLAALRIEIARRAAEIDAA